MAELEFKYLNEIDISDSLTDSAHVIVEDGGNIRRAPMNQLVTSSGVSSWNDLTDRPFYEEGSYEEILPETELSFVNYYGMYMSDTVVDHTKIVIGQTYTMIWDGITYTAPAFASSGQAEEGGETITLAAIGNPGISNSGEDNGIPFYGCNTYSGGAVTDQFAVVTTDTAATHTLSISAGSTAIHTLDEKFIPDTIARTSDVGVKSWNDLTDKPFYEEGSGATIEWDGSTEGRDSFTSGATWYKVSDNVPTKENLTNGTITMLSYETSEETDYTIESDYLQRTDDFLMCGDGNFIVVYTAGASIGSTAAPSVGVYFLNDTEYMRASKLTYGSTTIKTLDEKFIPDTIARKSDLQSGSGLPEVTTENNGQILGVTDGVWSVMDAPSGVSSWNDLTDKPFYEEGSGATIEWDGNTEGRDIFTLADGFNYYKVSDVLPTKSELIGGTVLHSSDGEVTSVELTEDTVIEQDGCILCGEQAIVIQNTSFTLMEREFTVDSTGLYFFYTIMNEIVAYTPKLTYGSTTIKTLDEKFIPDTIARVGDVGVKSWNDLEDKPFGETTSLTELHSETLTFDTELANFYRADCIDFNYVFEAGKTYTVIWDGISYSCTAYTHTPSGYVVIGDYGFANGTGEPFYAFYNDIVSSVRFVVQETGTHTIVVCGEEAVTKTLDEKFIPDTIARVEDIPEQKTYTVNGVAADENGNIEIEVGGSGLPEVTTENNGAFLRVVDGAWAIVNITDVSIEGA